MLWLLFSALANAHTVLIQSPQSPVLDYQAMLKAHPEFRSPTQYYRGSHPLLTHREQLLALFSTAQKAFLQKTGEESAPLFRAVLDLMPVDDWEASDREIFLYAYLRLAQLATTSAQRDQWLSQSLLLGDQVNYDPSLFPPPLLMRRAELDRAYSRRKILIHGLPPGWTQVLINGNACSSSSCGLWTAFNGKVRVTYLSDQWLPRTVNLQVAEIEKFHPTSPAFTDGDCDQPRLRPEANHFPERKVFYGLNCPEHPPEVPQLALSEPMKSPPFYHNKWLWAGVGIVITALVVSNNSHREEKRTPTTSYGY